MSIWVQNNPSCNLKLFKWYNSVQNWTSFRQKTNFLVEICQSPQNNFQSFQKYGQYSVVQGATLDTQKKFCVYTFFCNVHQKINARTFTGSLTPNRMGEGGGWRPPALGFHFCVQPGMVKRPVHVKKD